MGERDLKKFGHFYLLGMACWGCEGEGCDAAGEPCWECSGMGERVVSLDASKLDDLDSAPSA